MALPPFNLVLGAVVVTVAVLLFWWPMRSTRKARGKQVAATAGLPEHGRVLVYFFSPHCHNCREVAPLVDQIAGQGKQVVKINIAESRDLAGELGIRVVPTVALIEDGMVVQILAGNQARRVDSLAF